MTSINCRYADTRNSTLHEISRIITSGNEGEKLRRLCKITWRKNKKENKKKRSAKKKHRLYGTKVPDEKLDCAESLRWKC